MQPENVALLHKAEHLKWDIEEANDAPKSK